MNPVFGDENHECCSFFRVRAEKVFPGPNSIWFVWAEWDERSVMQFMQFSASFAMSAFLA